MPAQRTDRWARCRRPLPASRPIAVLSRGQVVDYLRSSLDEAAGITGDLSTAQIDAVLTRARTIVRRRRLRAAATTAILLTATALAGFLLGAAL